jgi:hypothetical protein
LRFDKRSCILFVEVKEECMAAAQRVELPQGTLDLLVLQTLEVERDAWRRLAAAMAQVLGTT